MSILAEMSVWTSLGTQGAGSAWNTFSLEEGSDFSDNFWFHIFIFTVLLVSHEIAFHALKKNLTLGGYLGSL